MLSPDWQPQPAPMPSHSRAKRKRPGPCWWTWRSRSPGASWLVNRMTRYFELSAKAEIGQKTEALRALKRKPTVTPKPLRLPPGSCSSPRWPGWETARRARNSAALRGQVTGHFAGLCSRLAEGLEGFRQRGIAGNVQGRRCCRQCGLRQGCDPESGQLRQRRRQPNLPADGPAHAAVPRGQVRQPEERCAFPAHLDPDSPGIRGGRQGGRGYVQPEDRGRDARFCPHG